MDPIKQDEAEFDWKKYASELTAHYRELCNILIRSRKECRCSKGKDWRAKFDQENTEAMKTMKQKDGLF